MKIPKGYIFYCPICGKPLYSTARDIDVNENIHLTIKEFIGIYPQPLMDVNSKVIQTCHYCQGQFNFLDLVKTYFKGGYF